MQWVGCVNLALQADVLQMPGLSFSAGLLDFTGLSLLALSLSFNNLQWSGPWYSTVLPMYSPPLWTTSCQNVFSLNRHLGWKISFLWCSTCVRVRGLLDHPFRNTVYLLELEGRGHISYMNGSRFISSFRDVMAHHETGIGQGYLKLIVACSGLLPLQYYSCKINARVYCGCLGSPGCVSLKECKAKLQRKAWGTSCLPGWEWKPLSPLISTVSVFPQYWWDVSKLRCQFVQRMKTNHSTLKVTWHYPTLCSQRRQCLLPWVVFFLCLHKILVHIRIRTSTPQELCYLAKSCSWDSSLLRSI